jgi:hypothetical protein
VTAHEYRKRTKYFSYLNIDVYDKSDEDIKKHFRITNRFISDVIFYKISKIKYVIIKLGNKKWRKIIDS